VKKKNNWNDDIIEEYIDANIDFGFSAVDKEELNEITTPKPNQEIDTIKQKLDLILEMNSTCEGAMQVKAQYDELLKARMKEIEKLIGLGTFWEESREKAQQEGYKIYKSRWVLTDAGGRRKARFVAKQFAIGKSSLDATYFASTPTLIAFRMLLIVAAIFGFGVRLVGKIMRDSGTDGTCHVMLVR
jgi:hypothetical protein